MASGNIWSISAEWVVPGDGPAIRHGTVRGKGAKIEEVGPSKKMSLLPNHRDLGAVVVMPGLVNAHTRLEMTHLRGQLPRRATMPEWLLAMVNHKPTGAQQDAAVADGAEQSLATGTTTLADTSHNHRAWRVLKDTPLRKLCILEMTGIGRDGDKAIASLANRMRGIRASSRMRFGIAAQAPYLAGEEVYRKAVTTAAARGWTVATALAQTEAERQFLLHGSGRLFTFLSEQGSLTGSPTGIGLKPVQFAGKVGLLDRPCILQHVNCIDDEELNILAGSRASVVYCPESNVFFGHTGHRYPEMIQAGINVALGTDGLACAESLSMLETMRRLRLEGRVDSYTILRMATLNGAKALGWDEHIGSLARGKQADWIAVELPAETHHPLEAVFTSRSRVLQTVIAGKCVYTLAEDLKQDS